MQCDTVFINVAQAKQLKNVLYFVEGEDFSLQIPKCSDSPFAIIPANPAHLMHRRCTKAL